MTHEELEALMAPSQSWTLIETQPGRFILRSKSGRIERSCTQAARVLRDSLRIARKPNTSRWARLSLKDQNRALRKRAYELQKEVDRLKGLVDAE